MPAKDFAFAWSFYTRRKVRGRNNDILPVMIIIVVPCLAPGGEVQGKVGYIFQCTSMLILYPLSFLPFFTYPNSFPQGVEAYRGK